MARLADDGELDQRTAALKRFREMLQTQGDRFQDYLAVLDKEQDRIAEGDTEALLSYVEMEEHIVRDIFNLQKVIDPLERLCRDLAPSGDTADTDALKARVARLGEEAATYAARNRSLLARRMTEIRSEIKSLRGNPHAARQSVYADSGIPLMIDLEG